MTNPDRFLFNLRGDDAKLFYKAKAKMERAYNVKVSRIHIIRVALTALIDMTTRKTK
jgi:hypothetical protein